MREADLLLHVIDASDEQRHQRIQQVNEVIQEIGAESVPQIHVYNKIDRIEGMQPRFEKATDGLEQVWVSARENSGIEPLLGCIEEMLWADVQLHDLMIPASAGRLRASLYQQGDVREDSPADNGGWIMKVGLDPVVFQRLCHEQGLEKALMN